MYVFTTLCIPDPHCSLVGDLDPVRSPYTLTPLKVVYKKLRLLVDSGCIFIGHGLSKDFRIISELYFYLLKYDFNIFRHFCATGPSNRYGRCLFPPRSPTAVVFAIPRMVYFAGGHPDRDSRLH